MMGLGPIFCLWAGPTMTTPLRERLIALIEPLVDQLGYELVDLEYAAGRAHALVRVFIDRAEGVGLEDCEHVSHEVSALLDVEDPVPTAYSLEVSSPGLDRVLRTPAHFARFVGKRLKIELLGPHEGRRRYTGMLVATDDTGVQLEVDGQVVRLAYAEIGRARLVPEWPQVAGRKVRR
jgi:ribosome maturation factor RimP